MEIPVLIGVGRFTLRARSETVALKDIIATSVREALRDATDGLPSEAADALLQLVDTVACPGTFFELQTQSAVYPNLPASVAGAVGATVGTDGCITTGASGNSPQSLINMLSEKIAAGEKDVCIVAGGEMLRTTHESTKEGTFEALCAKWRDDPTV